MTHSDTLRVGAIEVRALATPGHTDESVSYLVRDRVFTGNGRTDFQNGDAGARYDSITRVLFALPDDTLAYPAHGYKGYAVNRPAPRNTRKETHP